MYFLKILSSQPGEVLTAVAKNHKIELKEVFLAAQLSSVPMRYLHSRSFLEFDQVKLQKIHETSANRR